MELSYLAGMAAVVLPAFLLLLYFVYKDVNPEPLSVVAATVFFGCLGVPPMLAATWWYDSISAAYSPVLLLDALVRSFLVVALLQEGIKFLVLTRYAMHHKEFDETMDGVVYGVAAAVGFAAAENSLMAAVWGIDVGIIRGLFLIPAHAAIGVCMGVHIGTAKTDPSSRSFHLSQALWTAVLLHALFDLPLTLSSGLTEAYKLDSTAIIIGFIASFAVLVYIWSKAMSISDKLRKKQFGELPISEPQPDK